MGEELGIETPANRFIYTALKLHSLGAAVEGVSDRAPV
jgi:hypothetical protein